MVIEYYNLLYNSEGNVVLNFSSSHGFPSIDQEDLALLSASISYEEVRSAIFGMGSFKSPGPDGFHPLFLKSQWNIVGHFMHDLVVGIFLDPSKIGEINQTFISLIPKCDDPSIIVQFRPIAICNVSYKVVTKIISQRLKSILPYVVSSNQSNFILGRSTVDNILVLQESIHSMNNMSGKNGFMILKLDL